MVTPGEGRRAVEGHGASGRHASVLGIHAPSPGSTESVFFFFFQAQSPYTIMEFIFESPVDRQVDFSCIFD